MIAALRARDVLVLGKPPAIYDAHGRTRHGLHGAPTPQALPTATQSVARRSKRKAQRAARKRGR